MLSVSLSFSMTCFWNAVSCLSSFHTSTGSAGWQAVGADRPPLSVFSGFFSSVCAFSGSFCATLSLFCTTSGSAFSVLAVCTGATSFFGFDGSTFLGFSFGFSSSASKSLVAISAFKVSKNSGQESGDFSFVSRTFTIVMPSDLRLIMNFPLPLILIKQVLSPSGMNASLTSSTSASTFSFLAISHASWNSLTGSGCSSFNSLTTAAMNSSGPSFSSIRTSRSDTFCSASYSDFIAFMSLFE